MLLPSDRARTGMLKSAAGYLTWGEINQEVLEKVLEKRGKSRDGARLDRRKAKSLAARMMKGEGAGRLGIRPVFALSPPSHGISSVRLLYPRGDMGYRGEGINELLERMI